MLIKSLYAIPAFFCSPLKLIRNVFALIKLGQTGNNSSNSDAITIATITQPQVGQTFSVCEQTNKYNTIHNIICNSGQHNRGTVSVPFLPAETLDRTSSSSIRGVYEKMISRMNRSRLAALIG